jgi:hypothetical protein
MRVIGCQRLRGNKMRVSRVNITFLGLQLHGVVLAGGLLAAVHHKAEATLA